MLTQGLCLEPKGFSQVPLGTLCPVKRKKNIKETTKAATTKQQNDE